MSDGISGIKIITPSYPVKPVRPAHKDRESGKRDKDRPKPDTESETEPTSESDDSEHDKPVIDEYI